jgi:hypothetical protein
MQIRKVIAPTRERLASLIKRGVTQFWPRFYSLRYHVSIWKTRYQVICMIVASLALVGLTIFLAPRLQAVIEPQLTDQTNLANFRSLFLNLGSALVGATAIAFSLVMFAMQVNIERMPHGLFQKLSSDVRILGAFVGSFVLAISLACTSLVPDKSWIAIVVVASPWTIFLILSLFLYAYERALLLINPIKQLNLLTTTANRELRIWGRWANRVAPLLDKAPTDQTDNSKVLKSSHDVSRLTLFRSNPNWTDGARRSIFQAITFARRYAESGDYEVSGAALSAILSINYEYVQAKGKTFFGSIPFFDNPLTTDAFINDSLEHFRQHIRIGIARRDEQQIEQTLQALTVLLQIYVQIDYANEHASKTHAHLAGHYLSESVKAVTRHELADVVIEGTRLMGQSALVILVHSGGNDIATLATDIATIASLGAINEKYHAVTLIGVEQLTTLTLALLRSDTHDVRFAAGKLRADIAQIAKIFLSVPELPLRSPSSMCLAPYYSATNSQGFLTQFTDLVNALGNAKPDDETPKRIIRHVENWAEGSYQLQKELLLLAIEKRSQFAFDVIYWVNIVAKLLMALSHAPACAEYAVDKLRKHATWLIYVLSWIPDDKDSTSFVESYQLTETLFETALDAQRRGWSEFSAEVRKLQFEWAFKAGKYESGWHVLERSVYGMATLALLAEDNHLCEALKTKIKQQLVKPDAPQKETRDRAARNIRGRAATLPRDDHSYSRIEGEMNRINHQKSRPFLEDLANIISPDTAGEPVRADFPF